MTTPSGSSAPPVSAEGSAMTAFGFGMRTYRRAKGITLRDVARQLGLSAAYISDMERGNRHAPGIEIVDKWADVIGYPRDMARRNAAGCRGCAQCDVLLNELAQHAALVEIVTDAIELLDLAVDGMDSDKLSIVRIKVREVRHGLARALAVQQVTSGAYNDGETV